MRPARGPYCHLLQWTNERRPAAVRYGAAPTRSAKLRVGLVAGPDRLLVQRCTHRASADATLRELLLARLVLSGPAASAHAVGVALLRELAALRPDAFAPFPALLAAGPSTLTEK